MESSIAFGVMSFDASELPKQFGSYLLKQKIASGGMAELYLAEVKGPGGFIKPLVIKMIHRAYSDDERFLSMFTEEAKIVSGLTHGNIVPIFDFGEEDGLWYLAMEFIDGVDVATLVDVCRIVGINLSVDITLYIGTGTAAALAHAHDATSPQGTSLGLVHRDVSPQNILVSRSGEVKLCDFGLAAQTLSSNPVDGEIKGKLRYLSPEQAAGQNVDHRSDLFSLGVVLYELLAGHHPVPMGTEVTVLQTLSGKKGYPTIRESAPWISEAIADVVDSALAFSPEGRPSNAEVIRAELSHILHRDYPEFTPRHLASLVVRVQSSTESLQGDDADSVVRARLASFASRSRTYSSIRTSSMPSGPPAVRTRRLVLILMVVAGLALPALLFSLLFSKDDRSSQTSPDTEEAVAPKPLPSETKPHPIKNEGAVKDERNPETKDMETAPSETKGQGRASGRAKGATEKRPRALGSVSINASPWANVNIDGVDYTTTPILGLKLSAGKHKAVFTNPELGITKTRTFTVKPDETVRLLVEME
jgi:serine/threonine protein kinase